MLVLVVLAYTKTRFMQNKRIFHLVAYANDPRSLLHSKVLIARGENMICFLEYYTGDISCTERVAGSLLCVPV